MNETNQRGRLIVIMIGILGFLVLIFYVLNSYIFEEKQATSAPDYKDAEYVIEGKQVQLIDGRAEMEESPGSASKTITQYFGNELFTDLDKDGREDVVFLITQQGGGSGTFYYVVAALNTDRGYVGSEALFLGDRIAPQNIQKGNGNIVVVNYADRSPNEPFSTPPSIGKSIWLLLDPASRQFGEVEQNFEGEADPSRMTLQMKTWNWISVLYNDGRVIEPKEDGTFTLTFGNDGKFSATTDCNSVGGSYIEVNNTLTFSDIFSTKMYCEGSQEDVFLWLLRDNSSYHFTSKGELVFDLKFDSGSAVFR